MAGYEYIYTQLEELREQLRVEIDPEALEELRAAFDALRAWAEEVKKAWADLDVWTSELGRLNREIDLYTQKEQRRRADLQAAARFQALNARAAQDRARQILRNRKRLPRYRTKQRKGQTHICD